MTNGDASETVSRRGFLTAVTGAAATAGATGAAAEGDGATTTTAGGATTTQGGTTTAPGTTTGGEGTTTGADGTTTGGEGTTTSGSDGGAGPTEEVVVGPGGSLVFEPDDLTITPGTTVNFVWDSDNHNVVPESIPDDATWEGTPGAPSKTYNTGYEYSYTFEVEGEYEYFCQPHKGAGMVASITVEQASAGGGAGGPPPFPDSALTFGVTSIGVMLSTLALAYFFVKYGGDYETPE
jgi:plastocyanin